ncbi:MAG: hypothetical protein V9G13_04695 [Marmoricola sp.]|jgi:hypothetical protein
MHAFRLVEGAQITRLGGGTLQIYLDPARRVRVVDSPQNRDLLRRLRAPGEGEIDPINRTLQLLREQGLVSTITSITIAEQRLVDARVFTRGLELSPTTWRSLGLRRVSRLQNANFAILIGKTQTSSQTVTNAQIPHVLGDYPGGTPRLGPFIVPGTTPCLACIEPQALDDDPLAATTPSADPPRDDSAQGLLQSFLLQDLLTWLRGELPWTWARTILLGTNPQTSRLRDWLRHPECTCTWS